MAKRVVAIAVSLALLSTLAGAGDDITRRDANPQNQIIGGVPGLLENTEVGLGATLTYPKIPFTISGDSNRDLYITGLKIGLLQVRDTIKVSAFGGSMHSEGNRAAWVGDGQLIVRLLHSGQPIAVTPGFKWQAFGKHGNGTPVPYKEPVLFTVAGDLREITEVQVTGLAHSTIILADDSYYHPSGPGHQKNCYVVWCDDGSWRVGITVPW